MNEKVAAMRAYVETALNTMFTENAEAHAANPERIERLAGLAELNVHRGAGDEYKKAYPHYLSLEV